MTVLLSVSVLKCCDVDYVFINEALEVLVHFSAIDIWLSQTMSLHAETSAFRTL